MLEITDLHVSYGAIRALRGVSISVPEGGTVGVVGANGAGKTTLLRSILGDVAIGDGAIEFVGEPLGNDTPYEIVGRRRIAHVPEGRRVFPSLTVEDNLLAGAYSVRDRTAVDRMLVTVHEHFPVLADRGAQVAGTLSGGEQQMLAIGRALMSEPQLLLLDEPSLGLAPVIVQRIREILQRLKETDMTILLVEQNAHLALSITDHCYVLETGTVAAEGASAALRSDPRIQASYLGG